MKKVLVLFLALHLSVMAFAQEKRVRIEAGLNYPIGLQKEGNEENHIGLYVAGAYRFADSPLSVNLKLSYDSYTVVQPEYYNSPFNGRSLSLMAAALYHHPVSSKINVYGGAGIGVSVDNTNTGVFNVGHEYHLMVTPQIGVELFKHINVSAQYHISHKDFSRLMIGIGYIF